MKKRSSFRPGLGELCLSPLVVWGVDFVLGASVLLQTIPILISSYATDANSVSEAEVYAY